MATTNKRARELARAKEERRRAREAALLAKKKRRRKIIAVSIAAVLVVGAAGYWLWSSREDDSIDSASPASLTAAGQAITSGEQPVASCTAPGEIQDPPLSFDSVGSSGLGDSTQVEFTFYTNCGDIVVESDRTAAPATLNAMAFLANEDYFDNTLCHRLTTDGIYVLQCGDPTATGSGTPGFTLPDENLPAEGTNNYPAGTVAMANSGPGTSGSQFFIVYEDSTLPASYTIWGTVTSGLDVVTSIAAEGTTNGTTDGAPAQAVMIQDVTVTSQ